MNNLYELLNSSTDGSFTFSSIADIPETPQVKEDIDLLNILIARDIYLAVKKNKLTFKKQTATVVLEFINGNKYLTLIADVESQPVARMRVHLIGQHMRTTIVTIDNQFDLKHFGFISVAKFHNLAELPPHLFLKDIKEPSYYSHIKETVADILNKPVDYKAVDNVVNSYLFAFLHGHSRLNDWVDNFLNHVIELSPLIDRDSVRTKTKYTKPLEKLILEPNEEFSRQLKEILIDTDKTVVEDLIVVLANCKLK